MQYGMSLPGSSFQLVHTYFFGGLSSPAVDLSQCTIKSLMLSFLLYSLSLDDKSI